MPFQSQAQRSWMFENHPAVAKRWEAVTEKGRSLPGHVSGRGTSSEESPNPRIQKLPRPPAEKRDFGPLHPSAKARLGISRPASERDSMAEGGVESHTRGERGKMSLSYRDASRLQGRDVKKAERRP